MTTIPNTNTTIPTPNQSSKLLVKKIPITTETNIDDSKQATNKLPTEKPPIPFSSKRLLSQSSTEDKPGYVNLNDTDSIPPPNNPHKKNRNSQTKTTFFRISSFRFRQTRGNVSPNRRNNK